MGEITHSCANIPADWRRHLNLGLCLWMPCLVVRRGQDRDDIPRSVCPSRMGEKPLHQRASDYEQSDQSQQPRP